MKKFEFRSFMVDDDIIVYFENYKNIGNNRYEYILFDFRKKKILRNIKSVSRLFQFLKTKVI